MEENFPKGKYTDVLGLCKSPRLREIETQGWSLNPGRYVGVAERAPDDFEFCRSPEELNRRTGDPERRSTELEEPDC